MAFAKPCPLPENAGLVYRGERLAPGVLISDELAVQLLGSRNRNGKSNRDVLRQIISATDPQAPSRQWQIDFPETMGEHEASLYESPFAHRRRNCRSQRDGWWHTPHTNESLRASLAKLERYLATPISANPPEFFWIESSLVPDDSLIAIARDDDYLHGVVASPLFSVWWQAFHSRRSPVLAFETFPFPWTPTTQLSALTAAQEEHRLAISRAARSANQDALNTAVLAAYGWPGDLPVAEILEKLFALNRTRAG